MDKIILRDLAVQAVIGTFTHERTHKQNLIINLELGCDLAKAGATDNLEDTVDYFKLEENIVQMVSTSHFFLIERLAEEIASICLADSAVKWVKVVIDKPDALKRPRSVAVQVERWQAGCKPGDI